MVLPKYDFILFFLAMIHNLAGTVINLHICIYNKQY